MDGPRPHPDAALEESGLHVVNIFRLEPGGLACVRTLSVAYDGLLTHYDKRSWYCPGEGHCPPNLHRRQPVWKGYAAIEVYHQGTNAWYPKVLELTEHCELDMRGQWKRGQVWELSREMPTGKRKTAIRAVLLEEIDPKKLPSPFDYRQVLTRFYHAPVALGVANPMPARLVLPISPGDPPCAGPRKTEQQETPEVRARVRDTWKEFLARGGVLPNDCETGGKTERNGKQA